MTSALQEHEFPDQIAGPMVNCEVFATSTFPPGDVVLWTVSVVLGCAVAWFAYALVSIATRPLDDSAETWEFENRRRVSLRSNSLLYLWFEPLLDELAAMNVRFQSPDRINQIDHCLALTRSKAPWKASEFCACSQMEGMACGLLFGAIAFPVGGIGLAILLFPLCAWGYTLLATQNLENKARERLTAFKRRLPFAVDLIALMMDAGAAFLESLKTVVAESRGTVLAEELSDVVARMEAAQGRRESLEWLQHRMADTDVNELIVAIIKGEELGTPLVDILKRQANQMRLKRSQWAEKAVGESLVKLSFPELLVMLACMLIVVAPFLLAAVN